MLPIGRLALLLACFVGCLPQDPTEGGGCGLVLDDPLAAILVDNAHLDDVTLWQAGLLGGRSEGRATLVVQDDNGNVINFAAVLEGSHVGLVADASIDVTGDAIYPLVLPAAAVSVRDLLGRYQGPHVGIDVVAGFHWRELANPSAVRLNVTTLSFGLGFVPASWEIIGLQVRNDPADFVAAADGCGLFGCDPCATVDDFDGLCDDACTDDLDCPLDCRADGICDPGCVGDDVCPSDQLEQRCTRIGAADGQGSCADGLVCIRSVEEDALGVCREACGTIDAGTPVKGTFPCSGGSTCQVATSAPRAAIEGVVCLAARRGADEQCGAVFDELYDDEACAAGFDCRGSGGGSLVAGEVRFSAQRCKEVCDADDPCGADEKCLPAGAGPLTCGVPVPALTPRGVEALPPENVCNEIEGRRYCDQSMFAGVAAPGLSLCLAASSTSSDGFCFPVCQVPAFDRDGDGVLEEPGALLECAAGFACTNQLALAALVVEPLFDASGRDRPCDAALCPAGEPCAACGPGDVTCATIAGADVCVAPFGSCAPVQ